MVNHSKDFIINSSVIFLAFKIIIVELSTEITGLTLLIRVNQSTLILHSLKGLTTLNNISLITKLIYDQVSQHKKHEPPGPDSRICKIMNSNTWQTKTVKLETLSWSCDVTNARNNHNQDIVETRHNIVLFQDTVQTYVNQPHMLIIYLLDK